MCAIIVPNAKVIEFGAKDVLPTLSIVTIAGFRMGQTSKNGKLKPGN